MRDLTSKRNVILLSLLAGVLALVSSGRTWVTGTLNDGVLNDNNVHVSGNQAMPGFFGVALVAAAAVLAAATAGRIVRWPAAIISLIASGALVVLAIKVMMSPADAVRSRMTSVVGHTGEAYSRGTLDLWFWIALFAALLSVFASVLALVGLRRWSGLSSRYEAPVAEGDKPARTTSDWELMNQGIDPTAEKTPTH